ncbi:MAG: alpha/beta hydrolase [Roseburia sp.]|nr:alpha/beta hydrolase [Roseburia sp.]
MVRAVMKRFAATVSLILAAALAASCAGGGAGMEQDGAKTVQTTEQAESGQEEEEMLRKKSGNADYSVSEKSCEVDGKELYGVLYKPEAEGKMPLIIFSHELGCTHSTGADYAEYYAKKGIAVYAFDFRGGGYGSRSGNDMSKMSVMTEKEDLLAVYDEAKTWDFVDTEKIVLLGASQGGYVATIAAFEREDIAGLICIYPAYLVQDSVKEEFASYDDIPETFSFLGWFTAGKCYAADVWDYDIYEHMGEYEKPVLLLHGNRDGVVPSSYSQRASEVFPDADYHIIKNAGHGFYGRSFDTAVSYMDEYLYALGIIK